MKPERTQLRHEQTAECESALSEQAASQPQHFAAVEDLLRHDSEQNPVPPEVAHRLNRSLAAEPKPKKPWYRLFG